MSKNSNQSHKAAVRALAFSPDGTFLASGSDDTKVHLRSTAAAEWLKTRPTQGHEWGIISVVFSPDNRKVISLSQPQRTRAGTLEDSEVFVWDLVTNKVIRPKDGYPDKRVDALAASESVGVLTAGCFLRKLDMAAERFGEPLGPDPRNIEGVSSLDVSGAWVISGHYDGTIRTWDLVTGDITLTLGRDPDDASPATGAVVDALAALPETKLLVSAGRDRTLRIWDLATGQQTLSTESKEPIKRLAAAGPNRFLALDDAGTLWCGSTDSLSLRPLQDLMDVTAVASHTAKDMIALGQADGTVRVESAKELLPET